MSRRYDGTGRDRVPSPRDGRFECPSPVATPPMRSSCRASIYGEADRVLTLITPGGGKLKAIAKGIRRPTSRIGGSLEPFAELTVALARGRTFDVVTQVSVGHAWLQPARRPRERRDRLVPRRARRTDARGAPRRRAAVRAPAARLRAPRRRDGARAGSRAGSRCTCSTSSACGPEVDRCVECDRVLEADERFRWVPPLGGVLCERCPGPPHERAGLTLEALKLLKAYQRLDIEALAGLRLRPARRARGRDRPARLRPPGARARGALAGVPRRGPRAPRVTAAGTPDHRPCARAHHRFSHGRCGAVHQEPVWWLAGSTPI